MHISGLVVGGAVEDIGCGSPPRFDGSHDCRQYVQRGVAGGRVPPPCRKATTRHHTVNA